MKRIGLICLLLCLLLSGCASEETAVPDAAQTEIVLATPKAEHRYPSGDLTPLRIERGNLEIANGVILYPKAVSGDYADAINAFICDNTKACAEGFAAQVFTEYRIEYNDKGLFSLMMFIRETETDALLYCMPLNFDIASGLPCDLAYFFDPNDEGWRDALAQAVEQEAKSNDTVLLHAIAPVLDDRPFYISDHGLVIQYRLYEISTYSAGWPEFTVPIASVREYLAPNSPLTRLG
ncbi:MAG: RsiV family protein [Clostridia bacterium]|nr:RsiV family protein [Clostridia bacterium]